MINRVASSMIPKATSVLANNAGKGERLKKAMRNPVLHKVLETAAENQLMTNATYALALCCIARPITNYAVTEDKQNAAYASSHSIASGVMGFLWPMIFATPIAMGMKQITKNPQKYLKAARIKQFYPNVKVIDKLDAAGKKIGEKIATNAEGKMLRKDGKVLGQSLEPKMIYGEAERAAFEAQNAGFYVDKGGVVRSRTVFKTEKGQFKLDKDGNKIGCAVQEDLNPITEEMEIGVKKEQNVLKFVNMVPDTILAIPRAWLTIKLIPPILKGLGIKKNQKGGAESPQQQNQATPVTLAMRMNELKSPFSAMRKGA